MSSSAKFVGFVLFTNKDESLINMTKRTVPNSDP